MIGVLLDPRFWIRMYRVSNDWDKELNLLLDKVESGESKIEYVFISLDYVVTINKVSIWATNWPYAYGYKISHDYLVLPKRKTAIRLREVINKHGTR